MDLVTEFCLIFDCRHNEIIMKLKTENTRISGGDIISAAKTERMGGMCTYPKKNNLIT